jgi:hypothetical protein
MPNFNVHMAAGIIIAFLFAYFLYSIAGFSLLILAFGGIVAVLSAGFPDVDHEKSMPRKVMRGIVPGIVAVFGLYYFFSNRLWQQNLLSIAGLIAVCSAFVLLYEKFIPEHRGATHKLPGLAFVAIISSLVGIFLGLGILNAVILSIFAIVGFSSHVLLDHL